MVRHYSLSNPPPLEGALDGRETAHEAEILEVQALQAERDGECGRDILLMERALQIRCHLVNRLREKWANAASGTGSPSAAGAHRVSVLANADAVGKEELLLEYQAQCGELYDAAERLVVRCNGLGVEHFKRGAFSEASPLLEYAMQLTEDGAYPLCEVDERRRHLRGVTLNNLGCMERRRGHFSEALQYMKSSMEMTGVESPVAYMNTSAILIQLRLSDEAVRMAERSIELLYQTPEDPSLLAVAHHNLAMALEPVDPARCLEEYALAYRTACSTLGPESETSLSILRSWRRYEATRVPPAMGAFFTAGDGAAASRLRGLADAAGCDADLPPRSGAPLPHCGGGSTTATRQPGERACGGSRQRPRRRFNDAVAPALSPEANDRPPALLAYHTSARVVTEVTAADRLTTQASSTALLSSPVQSPGRGPRRPIKESGSSNHSLPMPLPRNLPPLQTAVAAEPPAVAPNPSYSRSLHDAKTNASLPPTSASLSLTSDPLTFLQNRLEILLQDEEELEHKYAQATVIQRYYRGHLAHRRVAALRATRASYARLAQLRRHMAARCIQRAFRRHRRHSRYPLAADQLGRYAAAGGRRGAQHQAATQLQRIARGWLARRHYAQLRKYTCESPAAAARIQRWIRALQARRHYAALLTAKAQQEAMALEHERRQYAATRIQGQWLTHLQRRACQAALRNRMMARAAEDARCRMRAAIIIQSAWRGYQARRLYQDTYLRTSQLRTARLEYERRRQAAVRLQAFGRMLIARQHATPLLTVARFRAAAEIRTRSHEGQAAIKIQCAYRRHVARRVCATKRAARKKQISQDLVQVRTATVQRAGRGYMARKDVGRKMSAVQAEAERYERRLLALKQKELGAARAVALASQLNISALRECEGEQRRMLARAEQQQWHDMLTQCNALLASTKETEVKQEAMKAISSVALHGFSRIIKAKKQRAHRQEARDAYLDQCAAEDAEAHKEASARVITDFMRSAAARSTLRSLVNTMSSYNDARAMQEEDDKTPAAATTDEAAPKRPLTAEQIAAERAELDRLERELLASEATAAPKRPLTAEQIAAERAELDRLEREELLASEATAAPKRPLTAEQIAAERAELDRLERELLASEATAAPKRPLTAEQIAAERAELDRLEREELLGERDTTSAYEEERPPAADESFTSADASVSASALADVMLARLKAIWQAELAAEKQRRQQREDLHRAIFEHRQQRIAAAEEGEELSPYRINRVHLQMPSSAAPKKALPSPAELPTTMGNKYRQERAAQERAAVHCIERYFISWGARKHLKALLRVLDEYLSALQDFDRHEGPVLTFVRLREVLARYPDLQTRVSQLPVSLSPPECAAIEDVNSSASPAISITSRKTLKGFSRIIKAKKQRAHRQEARDTYLDQCAAEDAEAHKEASARVITDFMRSAAARSTLRSLSKTMSSYNDARAMQEEDDKTPAAATTDEAAPKRPLTAEQIAAERAELDRLERELLASEATAAPKRPLTAEQIAAERAELDRLERELLASEATAAPKRPLTAEQIAAERAELDRLERELLASEATAAPKRPLTAEQIAAERAELDRLERELLASEATAAPKRPLTAEQIAAERAELDRLERELLASEATAAPKRPLTAEQIAAERAELDRLEREELLASEATAAPKRLLTAEQIAAERAELDRLERELLASEATAAPKRPLTAEQIAAERAELDRLERELLASEATAAPKRPLTAEQIAAERAELDRLERGERDVDAGEMKASPLLASEQLLAEGAVIGHLERWEQIGFDDGARHPPRRLTEQQFVVERLALDQLDHVKQVATERGRPDRPSCVEQKMLSAAALYAQRVQEERCSADSAHTSTPSSVRTFEPRQLEGLTSSEAGGRLWVFAKAIRDKKDLRQRQAAQMVNQEALCQLYHQERRSFASSLVGGFVDIIKAKKQRAHRQEARDAYLDQCAAEDAEAHKEASARVITDFMRSAAARSTLRSLSKTMSSYNDARAMQEEDDKTPAAPTTDDGSGEGAYATSAELCEHSPWSAALRIQRFFRGVQARRRVRVLQEAYRAYLGEELAVEELLYSAAVTIQCLYRGHLARRQAAMVIVQRDLYLLSLQEEDGSGADSKREEGSDAPLPAVLSFLASSPKIVAGGGAEAAATRSFTPRRSSSSSYTGLREVASTAIVTEVNEADEAALDQLLHRP
ncbi:IQ calmodulin-binding motif family protein [Leishmania donovani]|uniref:IQ calmodulin-binding motif family protein n=1 Tax=Leishmania donovani TaxID=5661 RepID=A0A504XQE2_LEIDO|nr:IQ calmodulin-binding motif family protein [Leishmania donovani]